MPLKLETVGCLFTYLKKRLNAEQFVANEDGIDVCSIEMISL